MLLRPSSEKQFLYSRVPSICPALKVRPGVDLQPRVTQQLELQLWMPFVFWTVSFLYQVATLYFYTGGRSCGKVSPESFKLVTKLRSKLGTGSIAAARGATISEGAFSLRHTKFVKTSSFQKQFLVNRNFVTPEFGHRMQAPVILYWSLSRELTNKLFFSCFQRNPYFCEQK